jgi:hypothetical protein
MKKPLAVNRIPAYFEAPMKLQSFETMDPHLLVGLVNTELRNQSESLDDLCKTHGIEESALRKALSEGGYQFSEEAGQFR